MAASWRKNKQRKENLEKALTAVLSGIVALLVLLAVVISISEDASGGRVPTIIETDKYEPKPMAVEEAAMQLDALKYEFLVFINSETERPNVIYRLRNGDFGLIDPGTGA